MKRFILIALTLMLALSLAACGGNEETPSGSDTTDPGTSQQEPSDTPDESTPSGSNDPGTSQTGTLFDITEEQISCTNSEYALVEDNTEREAMIAAIPAEILKGVGELLPGLCGIEEQPGDEYSYIFKVGFKVSGQDDYTALADYYKSLGGTVTKDKTTEALNIANLEMEFSWGKLYDCTYNGNRNEIAVTFQVK